MPSGCPIITFGLQLRGTIRSLSSASYAPGKMAVVLILSSWCEPVWSKTHCTEAAVLITTRLRAVAIAQNWLLAGYLRKEHHLVLELRLPHIVASRQYVDGPWANNGQHIFMSNFVLWSKLFLELLRLIAHAFWPCENKLASLLTTSCVLNVSTIKARAWNGEIITVPDMVTFCDQRLWRYLGVFSGSSSCNQSSEPTHRSTKSRSSHHVSMQFPNNSQHAINGRESENFQQLALYQGYATNACGSWIFCTGCVTCKIFCTKVQSEPHCF